MRHQHGPPLLPLTVLLAAAAGCGFKEYGTRTGPLPACYQECPNVDEALCLLMTSRGFERPATGAAAPWRRSCFGEWARIRQDTTDVLTVESMVSTEGQPASGPGGRSVRRIAVTARTFVSDGERRRQIRASGQVRQDADAVAAELRDLYVRR